MKKIFIALFLAVITFFAVYSPVKTQAATAINFPFPNAAKIRVATNLNRASHSLDITFSNLIFAKNISYELIYKHSGIAEGVVGQFNPRTIFPISKHILLGTCSTGGACVYHMGLSDMNLKVTTHYSLFDKTDLVNYNLL